VASYASISISAIQCVVAYMVNRFYCQVEPGGIPCDFAIDFDWICAGVVASAQIIYTFAFVVNGLRLATEPPAKGKKVKYE